MGISSRERAVMRAAYADPPYPGYARYYPEKEEVDHAALLERLAGYDAWALSTHSNALRYLLPMCPPEARVMAWVKPFASWKPEQRVAYAWEPVLVRASWTRGRRYSVAAGDEPTVRDWLAASIELQKGVVGAKPRAFCLWLFRVLGIGPDDELDDLYLGTGVIGRTWEEYRARLRGQLVDAPLFDAS